jgi:two-component system sensor histidine kinase KdpD
MSYLSVLVRSRRFEIVGAVAGLASMAVLAAVMFAFRSALADGVVALVLVVPVVVAVVIGGSRAGVVAVVAGFLLYDFVFIRPYYTFRVGSARNWLALIVYVAVVLLVAQVVSRLHLAEEAVRIREADSQRLLELSELLIESRPLQDLLQIVTSIVQEAFACEGTALLLPGPSGLEIVASSGRDLTAAELKRIHPEPGVASSLTPPTGGLPADSDHAARTETIVLSVADHPVGLIGLVGARLSPGRHATARGFANHVAIAIDRAQLQERALRTSVLEEVDRLRGALVGAVSHDLRTPLATIKTAATALLDDGSTIGWSDREELLRLIDEQADKLARLVTNLLDMSRIETGSLVVDHQPVDLATVIAEAVNAMRPHVPEDRIHVLVPRELPQIEADHVLLEQVLVNLIENALRYAPPGTAVDVAARAMPGAIEVAVSDTGPGFSARDRLRVFGLARPTARPSARHPTEQEGESAAAVMRPGGGASILASRPAASGSGVGLTIAKAFVEAHGGTISADNSPDGGARVAFSLPLTAAARR